jgi:hypothetical protein
MLLVVPLPAPTPDCGHVPKAQQLQFKGALVALETMAPERSLKATAHVSLPGSNALLTLIPFGYAFLN